ncbi:MAG: HAD family phosphatase [Endomicrobia bacterium]|nr:HAD family phosphatase [Endomicrobiia bacterium]
MSVKIIVFDLGNVIFKYDLGKFIDAYSKKTPDGKKESIGNIILEYSDLAFAYEKGGISTQDFYKALARETHYTGTYDEFCLIWNDIFQPPDTEITEILNSLSGKYKLGMLSNTNEQHIGYLKSKYPDIFALFGKEHLSHEMHMRKPDDEIYREVIKYYGLKPNEIFFTDDVQQNVAAAQRNGIAARLFVSAQDLRLGLKEAGVEI